jgi:hypothetical protein
MSNSSAVAALLLLACSGAAAAAAIPSRPWDGAVVVGPGMLRVAASDSGPFDGRYVGMITNVKQATACGSRNSWKGVFVVTDNKFNTQIGQKMLNGDVRPDGTFETTLTLSRSARLNLTGKIDGNAMHATGVSALCEYNMDMKKSPS